MLIYGVVFFFLSLANIKDYLSLKEESLKKT